MTRSHPLRRLVVAVTLLSLAFSGGAASGAPANPLSPHGAVGVSPLLTAASCATHEPGTLAVTGKDFTPGGEVDVVLYAQGSAEPDEMRAFRASPAIYGLNGSTDPALGFRRGGDLSATLAHPCMGSAMLRAYDGQTGAWSNWLHASLSCQSDT